MYNGFKNKPTYVVSLYLNNDESSYNHWKMIAGNIGRRHEDAVYRLADRLEDHFQEIAVNALETNPMLVDLLQWALADVDWNQIAGNFIDAAALEA